MSVVVDIKMPTKCDECSIRALALARCQATGRSTSHTNAGKPMNQNKRPSWCPIVKELPVNVGDFLYFAGYDDNFPDESTVSKYEVIDVSAKGLVRTDDGEWLDLDSDGCWMYRTRDEAVAQIRKLGGNVEE